MDATLSESIFNVNGTCDQAIVRAPISATRNAAQQGIAAAAEFERNLTRTVVTRRVAQSGAAAAVATGVARGARYSGRQRLVVDTHTEVAGVALTVTVRQARQTDEPDPVWA